MGERLQLGPSWELQELFCLAMGLSSSLFPFSCQSICCPAHFPSPFPPEFQAVEMSYLMSLTPADPWFDCLWLDIPPLVALR